MTQDQEQKERSAWRKRQILEAQEEEMLQKQREYSRPKTRWMLTCQQLGVCHSRKPRCPECED